MTIDIEPIYQCISTLYTHTYYITLKFFESKRDFVILAKLVH